MKDMVGATDCSSSHVITINDRLDALSSSPPTHTIFKIHELLRRENAMAYEPEILAIGPYHHGKERLQAMEVWKLRGLKSILDLHKERDARKYVDAMKMLEGRARECYSESMICNADEFAEMLLLDGCFIILFLLSEMRRHKHDTLMIYNHSFFKMGWVRVSLCRDMLLLENQIPLFVLEELFDLTRLYSYGTDFHDIAQEFVRITSDNFTGILIPPQTTTTSLSNVNDVEHLLGLLHRICCPSNSVDDNVTGILPPKSSFKLLAEKLRSLCLSISCAIKFSLFTKFNMMLSNNDEAAVNVWNSEIIPSATTLHDSGVTLKMKKGNPFEVTFVNGVMEVPIFNIFDGTETAYRNLIAYEQYCQESDNRRRFARHADFMDSLIDSPEDVALLRKGGIIANFIGDDEAVSTMCNKLCKHIFFSMEDNHYSQIFEQVNAYCRKRRHRWVAKLKRDYFNNPWSFISFTAAVFLLLLTFTQTVFSALGS